jgi:hypothetical protein
MKVFAVVVVALCCAVFAGGRELAFLRGLSSEWGWMESYE